jgi:hypothetical protein
MRPAATIVLIIMATALSGAAGLIPATAQAFDRYAQSAEQQMQSELRSGDSLIINRSPNREELYRRLRSGAVLIDSVPGKPVQVAGGLIHHWNATAFIPGATLAQVLPVVQDYDHLPSYYSPEVVSSRLLARDGDHFTIFMRLRKKKVVTAMFDTEYDVHFYTLDPAHVYSVSHSTRVSEVANAGEPSERILPAGGDHGFLWRMNSYWRFAQTNDGVYVECEAISLTRDIPAGLGWLIGPFITRIPEESLKFTLEATRAAVQRKIGAARALTIPALPAKNAGKVGAPPVNPLTK